MSWSHQTIIGLKILLILFLIPISFEGCAGRFCTATPADSPAMQTRKIAILPFENLSKEEGSGDKAGNIFLVKMLKTSAFEIADPGYVDEALGAERVRLTAHIPLSTLQGLGERLNVTYMLMGSVLEDEMQILTGVGGGGQVPSISITARVIDVSTGSVLWADAQSKRGTDYEKIFGFGRVYSTSRLMEIIAENMVSSLLRTLEKQGK